MTTPPVTAAEVRAHLNLTSSNGPLDPELQMHLEAATEAVENRVGPMVTSSTIERVTAARGWAALTRRPVVEVTLVATVDQGVATPIDGLDASSLPLHADAGLLDLRGYGRTTTFDVTYTAGRGAIEEIPARFKLAVLVVTEHLWSIQRGGGAAGSRWGTPDQGDDYYSDVVKGFALPRRALELIGFDEEIVIA